MHQIIMKDLQFKSHIGVFDFEKEQGQKFAVDLILDLGYIEAAEQDDLEKTVNYAAIFQLLENYFEKSKVDLLEFACGEIIQEILKFDSRILNVDLTLKKPQAPIAGDFAYMAVRQQRKRYNLVYLSIGSNLNDPVKQLDDAVNFLQQIPGISHFRCSSYIATKPWGKTDQPDFFNAATEFIYQGTPFELLRACQNIENKMGRNRIEKWGPRLIDIDIIFFGDLEINHPELVIPHPYFRERDFVMDPIMELKRQAK
ncbi:MAG TPA: 2-amino-4-hydroxy-6-hydroxymethyldihydropteridine diphosphokinase [Clostridiaceae bacterium]|nr:2-amino-4-hydroxy-6-hydroxymethyldihydropteridine diphosphokinase [Clostridiaceae bacterium]